MSVRRSVRTSVQKIYRDQSLLNLSCLGTFEIRTPLGTSLLLGTKGDCRALIFLVEIPFMVVPNILSP